MRVMYATNTVKALPQKLFVEEYMEYTTAFSLRTFSMNIADAMNRRCLESAPATRSSYRVFDFVVLHCLSINIAPY
jgi:hypothetical protein